MTPTSIRDLPSCAGVYILSLPSEVLYVGESTNLRRRWVAHQLRPFLSVPLVSLSFERCERHKQRERALIDELRPSLNGKSFTRVRERLHVLNGYVTPEFVNADPVVQALTSFIAHLKAI